MQETPGGSRGPGAAGAPEDAGQLCVWRSSTELSEMNPCQQGPQNCRHRLCLCVGQRRCLGAWSCHALAHASPGPCCRPGTVPRVSPGLSQGLVDGARGLDACARGPLFATWRGAPPPVGPGAFPWVAGAGLCPPCPGISRPRMSSSSAARADHFWCPSTCHAGCCALCCSRSTGRSALPNQCLLCGEV